jgi:homoserine kinase
MNSTFKTTATAFAPATVANVAVGFDLLGFPVENVGDKVTVTKTEKQGVEIIAINGNAAPDLPLDAKKIPQRWVYQKC